MEAQRWLGAVGPPWAALSLARVLGTDPATEGLAVATAHQVCHPN